MRAIIPEWHADTGDRVERLESVDRLPRRTDIPQRQLTVTHLRETGGRDPVAFSQPDRAAVLSTGVALSFMRRALLTHIPNPELLVSRSGDQERSVGAPGLRLHDVAEVEGVFGGTGFDIPDLHGEVTGGSGEDVLRSGIEKNMSDLPATM